MSDIPKHWKAARIRDVVLPFETVDPTRAPKETFKYVDIGSIDGKTQSIREPKVILGKDAPSRARRRIKSGDVLFSTVRTYLKNIAVVPQELDGSLTSTGIAILRASKEIESRFLFNWTRSPEFLNRIGKAMDGTLYPAVTDRDVFDQSVPLPPIDEQRLIVAKLDSLFARSKGAREELAHIPRIAERYKEAILGAAFRGELTREWRTRRGGEIEPATAMVARILVPTQPRGGREAAERVIRGIAALSVNNPETPVPEGWSWVPLTRIARQETGHTPSRSHPEWWGGDVPWIGIKDAHAHHGTVITDTLQTTNAEGLAHSAARILPAGTVCLSRTASIGYVLIMGRPMATSQDFVTWSCTEALLPKFLMYALMAERDEIRRFGKGSTHTTIYFPEVRALHICLAPIQEQQVIVQRIEAAFTRVDKLAGEARRATELLNRLDQATLAKAFRGDLVTSDLIRSASGTGRRQNA